MPDQPDTQLPNGLEMFGTAAPSVFFSFSSSLIDTVNTGLRLFRGSPDELRIMNKNWARTSRFGFRVFRTVCLLIAFLLFIKVAAVAAAFYAFVALATATYHLAKLGWSAYKYFSYKNQDEHKEVLKRKLRKNAVGAAIATAAAIVVVTSMLVPGGAGVAVPILALVSALAGLALVGYSLFELWTKQRSRSAIIEQPTTVIQNPAHDDEKLKNARELSHKPTEWHDYQYEVNHQSVIRSLYDESRAYKYLQDQIREQLATLKTQMHQPIQGNRLDFWMQKQQEPKRRSKRLILKYLGQFLEHIQPEENQPGMPRPNIKSHEDFNTAFYHFLSPEQRRLFKDARSLGYQSFFRHHGKVEDLFRGVVQHYEQARKGEYNPIIPQPEPMTPLPTRPNLGGGLYTPL